MNQKRILIGPIYLLISLFIVAAASAERVPFPELSNEAVTAARGDGDVVFVLSERPESGSFSFPRLNNVLKTVTVMGQSGLGYLRQSQTPTEWTIHLHPETRFPASILMTMHGRPLLCDEPYTASPSPNGEIVLSARHAAVHGDKLQFEPQPHKNTVGYWVDPKAWAEWRFEVVTPGRYQVRILQGCGQGQGGSDVSITVGDASLDFTVLATGHFQNFQWRELGELKLEEGVNELELRPKRLARNAVMDVRQIRLVPLESSDTSALPKLSDVEPDLELPPVFENVLPTPGKRVRLTLEGYESEHVSHIVYLPTDFRRNRKHPVLVELPGNGGYRNDLGDICTGRVEDGKLGYGISGGHGAICVTLPFLTNEKHAAETWWGTPPSYDVQPSLDYWRAAIRQVCDEFGGDADRVVLIGFSRGSLACNYLGLHDQETADLWKAMICCSHYDGIIESWPYPRSDSESATARLKRFQGRPQFICHELKGNELLAKTKEFTERVSPEGKFTFHSTGFVNHSDAWAMRPCPCRAAIRDWLKTLPQESR